jgi:NAD(P)-dependent dehydrogenase (short-subunit alcohol dehydrogenase family)
MAEWTETTIVITGAASGLGKAWAEGFLELGANVVAADVNLDGLKPLEELGALISLTDVSQQSAVEQMIDAAIDATGRIDVLFNNAGIASLHTVEELPDKDFERHIEIHLFGTIYAMRAAIPIMRSRKYGRIINTISRAAEVCGPGNAAYSAAKAGIWAATRSASKEVGDTDILINMLIPGPTNTAIWGRDMPDMQSPEATFPTARMLAGLDSDGPTGKVFWDEKEYPLFHPDKNLP